MFKHRPPNYSEPEPCYVETDPSGRYGRFNDILGKGATKTVYKAFDELRGMEVAWNQVKLKDVFRTPDELQRLYSEVHLLRTLNHDNIIKSYASWVDTDSRTINFITELFASGTLREYRQKYRRVDMRAIKNWGRQILQGLVYLHSHCPPIIHRDLKCDNIFINGHSSQVKIGDLGLAAILRQSQAAHSVIGTPEFMAPELYEEEYNELVDVYSFGMCVLEMLTADYPYSECSNPAQIYKKVTSGKRPDSLNRVMDPEAQWFIERCLQSAPIRPSAKELLLDPFLEIEDGELEIEANGETLLSNNLGSEILDFESSWPMASINMGSKRGTDFIITGKQNPDDDTIFLSVQMADKEGRVRKIYFPFDIVTDTVMDVATEMVKELEITDQDPIDIAALMEAEISSLVPDWKNKVSSLDHESFCYDDPEFRDIGPFDDISMSSAENSLHNFFPSCEAQYSDSSGQLASSYRPDISIDWSQEEWINEEDTSSQSSTYSIGYPNYSYHSAHKEGEDSESGLQTGGRKGKESCMSITRDLPVHINTLKTSRFCPFTDQTFSVSPRTCQNCLRPQDSTRLSRNRQMLRKYSMMDIRSQFCRLNLTEELRRLRLYKTVGAIENIGFHPIHEFPCKARNVRSPEMSSRTRNSTPPQDKRRQG
ncbi:probable serine/threonine-protein kinase WNK5 [Amborella trichopoda]|uniref:non-specific serine/threonine protein kinase n=1 Tax=Amborella trichopoda TaxID=13333 RepID=W1PCM4_AMBTC|nr:probable serine/threonine-protein kinase WNK5 [Amborella trichopoda]ERN05381.1 hypothetical protein AMTR_s00007p00211470 [Amborella trichopoda]|eukprot:XP_006843706.1 probable serine/threonine-protein kinase WNK5 [Amborella trichopoda]